MIRLIPLTQGKHAIVDNADYDWLVRYKWTLLDQNAAHWFRCPETKKQRMIYMHRMILDAPEGILTDHINHNRLDNRRSNLRLCNISESNCNRRGRSGKDYTHYKGIYPVSGKWAAAITTDKKRVWLGFFDTEKSAARAYDLAAIKYHKDFAMTNFPLSDYQQEDMVEGAATGGICYRETENYQVINNQVVCVGHNGDAISKGGKTMKPKSEAFRQVNITLPPAMVEALREIQAERISCPNFSEIIREGLEFWLKSLEK